MESKKELRILLWIAAVFGVVFFLPIESARFNTAIEATLDLAKWYAREHVVLCLLPAFFIAGVIAVFVSQGSVLRYFGANANKWMAYTVAALSGTILAVCSCTILPLFSSIHKRGAGLGPAVAFLYSGPAINILAIILTARILGVEMGVARVVGAISFSVVIGIIMSLIYRKEEQEKREAQMNIPLPPEKRPMWQTAFHFFTLIFILVFANWGAPAADDSTSLWYMLWAYKWYITSFFAVLLAFSLVYIIKISWQKVLGAVVLTGISALLAFLFIDNTKLAPLLPMLVGIGALSWLTLSDKSDENREWTLSAWDFAKQILPLLSFWCIGGRFSVGFYPRRHDHPRRDSQ
jgi:uncharacterized membrane protein YraQ (UPF0718 family)